MKKSDLHREWARVLDMCEGTNINPWQCVRQPRTKELHRTDRMPDFSMRPEDYEFAVAILKDKPVFAGDLIYHKIENMPYKVRWCDGFINDNDWSWNATKKTFMINGEELPCPAKHGEFVLHIQGFKDNIWYFKNQSDIKEVENAIIKLLKESTGNGE